MRLLHIADVHLGRKGRDEDILKQLQKVVEVCIEERVDLLLIAGDLFDRSPVPPPVKRALTEVLQPLRERAIQVVAICGNHDRGAGVGKGGLLFVEEPTRLTLKEATLHLFPFQPEGSGREIAQHPPSRTSPLEIAVCHASYVSNPRVLADLTEEEALYWPLTSEEVRGLPFDYLALGHYHNPLMWREGEVLCAYPGTIEPLSFKEEGPRKAFLLSWEGKLKVTEVDLGSQSPYVTLTWRVGLEVKEEEIPARIRELGKRRGFFKVIITGLVEDRDRLRASVGRPSERVKVDWRVVDMRQIQGDPLLEGFVKLVKEHRDLSQGILSRGLSLLGGHVD